MQYGISIPSSLKDLAKNPLDAKYTASFVPVSAAQALAEDFKIAKTRPADKDTIKPTQNPTLILNRPVRIFSAFKAIDMTPEVKGHWVVQGSKIIFQHKHPLPEGDYKVTIADSLTDLHGNKLNSGTSFGFVVKDFASKNFAGKSDDEKEVARLVEAMFDAYLTADLGRFSGYFHEHFRMQAGSELSSRADFLEQIRESTSRKERR
ncbi:MAG: hypothetical protein F6K08_29065, partial [Okeania sp. SIO1H6]|nr:hypothetical protein [Okeania sp. SIO1H6]